MTNFRIEGSEDRLVLSLFIDDKEVYVFKRSSLNSVNMRLYPLGSEPMRFSDQVTVKYDPPQGVPGMARFCIWTGRPSTVLMLERGGQVLFTKRGHPLGLYNQDNVKGLLNFVRDCARATYTALERFKKGKKILPISYCLSDYTVLK